MTNQPKRRYRIRNWRDYNKALVRRGSLTSWVEQGAVGKWRDTAAPVRRGRRRLYSDLAITCALTLREVYGLPLRATQGLVRSVLLLLGAGESEPHYSTLSRRAATLEVKPPRLSQGPLRLAVDSTGLKLQGEGEWKVRLHGKERWRNWQASPPRRPHDARGPRALDDEQGHPRPERVVGAARRSGRRGGRSLRRRRLRLPGLLPGHPRQGRAFSHPTAGAGAGERWAGVRWQERGCLTGEGGRPG